MDQQGFHAVLGASRIGGREPLGRPRDVRNGVAGGRQRVRLQRAADRGVPAPPQAATDVGDVAGGHRAGAGPELSFTRAPAENAGRTAEPCGARTAHRPVAMSA